VVGSPVKCGSSSGVELSEVGSTSREYTTGAPSRFGLGRGERHVGGDLDFFLNLRLDQLDLRLGGDALFDQPLRERRHGVAFSFFFTLARCL